MALPNTLPNAAAALLAHPLLQPLVRLLLALLGVVLGVYEMVNVYEMVSVYRRYGYGYKTRPASAAVTATSKNMNTSSSSTSTTTTMKRDAALLQAKRKLASLYPDSGPGPVSGSAPFPATPASASAVSVLPASALPTPAPLLSASASEGAEGASLSTAAAPASTHIPLPLPSTPTLPKPVHKPRPIPNSYWATPRLLACEYPWAPPYAGYVPICEAPTYETCARARASQSRTRAPTSASRTCVQAPAHAHTLETCTPNPAFSLTSATYAPNPTCPAPNTALALTSATYAPKLDALLRAGVRAFVDLTEPGELAPYSSLLPPCCARLGIDPRTVSYARFPIRDRCVPSEAEMYAVMKYLRGCIGVDGDEAESNAPGKVVAVHCRGGIGRTGMVVGCWLVECGAVRDGREALEVIEREWRGVAKCVRYPCSPETGAQVEFVGGFWPEGREESRVMRKGTGVGLGVQMQSVGVSTAA